MHGRFDRSSIIIIIISSSSIDMAIIIDLYVNLNLHVDVFKKA